MSNGSRGREYTSNDTSAEVTPREKILTSKFIGGGSKNILGVVKKLSHN